MREAAVESYFADKVEALGGRAYKFVSPGRRNVPDRLCVFPGPVTYFVELKAPGKTIRKGQQRELNYLSALGYHVAVLGSKEQVDTWAERTRRDLES